MRNVLVTLLMVVVVFILIIVTYMIYKNITESNFTVAFLGGVVTLAIGMFLSDNL